MCPMGMRPQLLIGATTLDLRDRPQLDIFLDKFLAIYIFFWHDDHVILMTFLLFRASIAYFIVLALDLGRLWIIIS